MTLRKAVGGARDAANLTSLPGAMTEIGMLRFFLTRLSLVVPTFIGITLLEFVLIRLIPGDPIETMAGKRGIHPVRHEQLRQEYGFEQPVLGKYGLYLSRLAHGGLGLAVVTPEPGVSQ